MEPLRFFWTSGLSLVIGGILYSAAWILFATIDPEHNQYTGFWWQPLNFMVIVGSILIALGLPGFYAFQAEPAGWPGLIGVVMLFVGLLLAGVAGQAVETFTLPHLGQVPAEARIIFNVAGPLLFFGIIITGIVVWRGGVYPWLAGVALVVAALAGLAATYVPMPLWLRWSMAALYSAVMAWLGFFLMFRS
jgi:hypothetical protein